MKKSIIFLTLILSLLLAFSFSSSAYEKADDGIITEAASEDDEEASVDFIASPSDITAEVEVLKDGGVVKTYEIITNNKTQNARTTLQKALRFARNNSSEEDIYTVRLPEGTYYFYSSLDIYSNTVFDLGGSTIYRAGNCAALIRFGEKNDVSYGYNGYKNITIKNGTLNGSKTGSTSLIRFAHAENIIFEDLTFTNTEGVMHLLTFAASNNVSVKGCTFSDMIITDSISKFNCEALQIDILKTGHFNYPAQDGTPSKNISITGCTFKNLHRGTGTHSAFQNHYFDNIKITGNTFENIEGYAVNAINYTNSLISGNTVKNCGSGINCGTVTNYKLAHFYGPVNADDEKVTSLGTVISDNTIFVSDTGYDHIAYGINVAGQIIEGYKDKDGKLISGDYRVSGVTVTGNTVTSTVSEHNFYGIQIEGAVGLGEGENSDILIKNNKITVSCNNTDAKTNYGLRILDSINVHTEGNTISDNGTVTHLESGVRLDDTENCRVINSAITGTSSFGIKLTNAKNTALNKNTLRKIGLDGIYVFSKSNYASITENVLYSPEGHGIYLRDSENADISSNKIYTPKDHGIYITSNASAKKVTGNLLSGINNHGIYLNQNASASSIKSNTVDIINKKYTGIYLNNTASAKTIESNLINATENTDLKLACKNGITINSKKCALKSLSKNTVKGSSDNAIVLFAIKSGSAPKINSNKIYSCKKISIYLTGAVSASSVSSNYICGSKGHGIYLNKKAAASSVSKNTIDLISKSASGIYLTDEASAKKVNSNVINAKKKTESKKLKVKADKGICINSKACKISEIKNNTVTKCSDTAICIFASKTKPSITGNNVSSSPYGIRYKKATLKANTFSKCSKAKTKKI